MNRILGIDHGDARIGIAVSDPLGMLAHPVETIHRKQCDDPLARIKDLVEETGARTLIVGMPRNMDGSYGPAAEKVRGFTEELQAALPGATLVLHDERLSTVMAERLLRETGKIRNGKRKAVIDQMAAQVILQDYLDSQAPMA